MAWDLEASIKFWKSLPLIDAERIEKIYAMIVSGVQKSEITLTEDEEKAWDRIADSVRNNPPPDGSVHELSLIHI